MSAFILAHAFLKIWILQTVFIPWRAYLEDPRNVTVQKGAEPLGISIVSGENGGVFVSKVTAGSIAHQAHLEYGDQLLEVQNPQLLNSISTTKQWFISVSKIWLLFLV